MRKLGRIKGIEFMSKKDKKGIEFVSKKDNKRFKIVVPETEDDQFIEINGKQRLVEEVEHTDYFNNKIWQEGELVFGIEELYDLYYYDGEFYEFKWNTASGCIVNKVKGVKNGI
jgi:hypothetical protein